MTGILEQHSLPVDKIPASSVFVSEPQSNYVQVQRILQGTRLTLEPIYYPFVQQMLAALRLNHAHITLDETNHGAEAVLPTCYTFGNAPLVCSPWTADPYPCLGATQELLL